MFGVSAYGIFRMIILRASKTLSGNLFKSPLCSQKSMLLNLGHVVSLFCLLPCFIHFYCKISCCLPFHLDYSNHPVFFVLLS
jgi:hypothetical protein